MTLLDAVSVCLDKRYTTASGRASRSEFWWFCLAAVLAAAVAKIDHPVFGDLIAPSYCRPCWPY